MYKMKGWNEYFEIEEVQEEIQEEVQEDQEESVNEEHHKETKEDQVEWICGLLPRLSEDAVKKVYDYIEQNVMKD